MCKVPLPPTTAYPSRARVSIYSRFLIGPTSSRCYLYLTTIPVAYRLQPAQNVFQFAALASLSNPHVVHRVQLAGFILNMAPTMSLNWLEEVQRPLLEKRIVTQSPVWVEYILEASHILVLG